MKKILFFLLTLALFSCEQQKTQQVKDTRPKNQILLVDKFKTADSIYLRQINDIRKSEVSDSAKNDISNFIIKDLNLKADKWQATVLDMTMDEAFERVDVKFMIPIENDPEEKHPQFSSIILLASVDYKLKKVVNIMRNLTIGSKVLLSGKFTKADDGTIFILGYAGVGETDFSNPELTFELTDITKN